MRLLSILFCLATLLSAQMAQAADVPVPEFDPLHAEKMKAGLDLFKAKVREVLVKSCVDCHGGDEVQSGFDLATRKGLIRGGSKGPAVVAGKAMDSNLIRFISRRE